MVSKIWLVGGGGVADLGGCNGVCGFIMEVMVVERGMAVNGDVIFWRWWLSNYNLVSSWPLIALVGYTCHHPDDVWIRYTKEMDLFAFIRHSDPTKVRIGERASEKGGDSDDSVDKLFDEAADAEQEHSVGRNDDVMDETVAKDVSEKLRDDYHAATFITGEKCLATIRSLVLEDSSVPSRIAKPHIDGLADSVSIVPDTPVMTIAVTTTVVADASIVLVSKDKVRSGNVETFGDSASAGEANLNAASSSKLNEPTNSSNSFYASQDLDSKTLHNIYIPKWKVTNDSVLDDPYVCRDLTDRLAPHALFLQLRFMDYDHLYTGFNVGSACQMCLGAKVRMRAEHTLEQKDRLKDNQLSIVDAAKNTELKDLKETNFVLKRENDYLSKKVTTLESMIDSKETELAAHESHANEQADVLGNRVAELDAQFLKMVAHLDEEFYPRFLTTIFGRRWILTHRLKLVLLKCLQSSEYLQALGQAISCVVNKCIKDGMKAGLSVIEAYDHSTKAKYIDAVNALDVVDFSLLSELKSKKDASMVDLMDSIRLEGPLAEIPRAKDLISATPVTTEPITTLSTTFTSFGVVPFLLISNDQVLDTEPNDADPPVVTFEEEELATSLE
uniref:Transposase (Putative), gypsy type n=1 Tax=Tanacetum cinerariifolium TaxID=118510 RepID=A0A6L2LTS0_TANCI|nr:hypothetical protein [Tanacetum cinerariifolium]